MTSEEASSGGSTAQTSKPDTMDAWDPKLLSPSGLAGAAAAAGLAHVGLASATGVGGVGVIGAGGAISRQQQQQLTAQQQQQLLAAGGGQQLGLVVGQEKFRHKGLSLFVIFLMCLLLALNVILLLKLWTLEERIDVDLSRRARMPNLAALKWVKQAYQIWYLSNVYVHVFRELPSTNQDWLELLRQQELSHESELRKWHQVLQTAIELLKKVSVVCEKIYNDGELRQSIESMHTEL